MHTWYSEDLFTTIVYSTRRSRRARMRLPCIVFVPKPLDGKVQRASHHSKRATTAHLDWGISYKRRKWLKFLTKSLIGIGYFSEKNSPLSYHTFSQSKQSGASAALTPKRVSSRAKHLIRMGTLCKVGRVDDLWKKIKFWGISNPVMEVHSSWNNKWKIWFSKNIGVHHNKNSFYHVFHGLC